MYLLLYFFFFFQAEDGIRDSSVTGVQTCALPIFGHQHRCRRTMKARCHRFGASPAFTLMEIMLVIGILAIVMAMAIPPIYRGMSKEPMRAAVSGVMDACTAARAAAILQGKTVGVVFHP